ncbi:MAG: hypothetical protein JSW39_25665 [Desulfobacterales bacterium]|nr:MAG: hypothetical protein JSW39_25665 [Desulfobacterales bacterium]
MIRWMRKTRISRGKYIPAIAWSTEITEYVKKVKELSSIEVFIDLFGEGGTVRWIVDYEDLATLEKAQAQVRDDPEYWRKLEQAEGLFIDGSTYDVVMRKI